MSAVRQLLDESLVGGRRRAVGEDAPQRLQPAIEQQPLRDALGDLAGVFKDELAGIRLLTRGFVSNDQTMIQSGDTTFKDATARAVELFEERVEPILERAEIDSGSLGAAVAELRG